MTTCIVGIGQRAAGDDAIGIRVVEALGGEPLGPDVELHVVGDATALVSFIERAERVIVVDAAVDAGPPGHVRVISPDALDAAGARTLSSHGLSVAQAIGLARMLSAEPAAVELVAVAIERPSRFETALSPAVIAAIPVAREAIRRLLAAGA